MPDFIRARSAEQKEQRMEEIKGAADRLFRTVSYHDITLTSISEELGCSRAQVYKYASTKEEIFLELTSDRVGDYFDALLAAFPEGCGYSREVFAEVWAGILNAHTDFLRYCDILMSIIETNVSVERLAQFKKRYYEDLGAVTSMLSANLGIGKEDAERLYVTVYFQAIGMSTFCWTKPLVKEALEMIGMDARRPDFKETMRDFILMCLERYAPGRD